MYSVRASSLEVCDLYFLCFKKSELIRRKLCAYDSYGYLCISSLCPVVLLSLLYQMYWMAFLVPIQITSTISAGRTLHITHNCK